MCLPECKLERNASKFEPLWDDKCLPDFCLPLAATRRHSPCSVVSLQLTPRAPVFLPHPAIRREMMDLTQGRDRVSVRGTRAFLFSGLLGPGTRASGP